MNRKDRIVAIAGVQTLALLCLGLGSASLATGGDKGKDKPLVLLDLLTREVAQKKELAAARKTGNDNAVSKLDKEQQEERDSWIGKQIRATGKVLRVTGGYVYLYIEDVPYNSKRKATISFNAKAKDNKDPALQSMSKGNLVNVQGITKRSGGNSGMFIIEEATFASNK